MCIRDRVKTPPARGTYHAREGSLLARPTGKGSTATTAGQSLRYSSAVTGRESATTSRHRGALVVALDDVETTARQGTPAVIAAASGTGASSTSNVRA